MVQGRTWQDLIGKGEYPTTPEGWKRYVYSVGLQAFGDADAAAIFERQMRQESGYSSDVIFGPRRSTAGAMGLAQYMPAMVTGRGVNPWDPFEQVPDAANLMKGYLADPLSGGDWRKALSMYNAGQGGTSKAIQQGADKWEEFLPAETRIYLKNILPLTPPGPAPTEAELPPEDILPSPVIYPEYNRDFQEAADRANLLREGLSPAIEELETRLTGMTDESFWEKSIKVIKRVTRPVEILLSPYQALSGAGSDYEKQREEVGDAQQQILALADEAKVAGVLADFMQYLPVGVLSGIITSEEDVRTYIETRTQGLATEPDYLWAVDKFNKARQLQPPPTSAISDPRELPTIEDLHTVLQKPPRPIPVAMHQMTDRAIIEALTKLYVPSPAYGLTMGEVTDLYREFGASQLDLDEYGDLQAMWEKGAEEWQAADEEYFKYRTGLEQPILPKLTAMQKFKMAVTQPFLAVVEVLEPYQRYIIEPAAAFVEIRLGGLLEKVGLLNEPSRFRRMRLEYEWNQAKQDGSSWWLAYGRAWETDESGWLYKLAVETLVDPLWLVEMGWSAAARSATVRRIPLVGKFVGDSWNLYMKVADAPFEFIRRARKRIPQTTRQQSDTLTIALHDNLMSAARNRFHILGSVFPTAEELRVTMLEAAEGWLRQPPGVAPATAMMKTGNALTKLNFIDPDEIADIARVLGVEDLIPTQTDILTVNAVFERLSPLASSGLDNGALKVPQAADLLIRQLAPDPTKLNQIRAVRILSDKLKSVIRNVENLARGDDPQAILQRTLYWARSTHISNVGSRARAIRMNQKALGAILDKADILAKAVWRDRVERHLVSPMASHYLLFLNYGPPNVIESAFRSFLDGGPILVDTDAVAYAQRIAAHLPNLPHDIRTGISRLEVALANPSRNTLPGRRALVDEAVSEEAWLMRIKGISAPWPGLRKITQRLFGKDIPITSFSELNLWFGELSTKIRASWVAKRWLNMMWEEFPEEMQAITRAIPDFHNSGIQSFSRKDLEWFQQYLKEEALAGGPERVRAAVETMNTVEHRKVVQEVSTIMSRDTVTPQFIKDSILREVQTGRLFRDVDGNINRARAMVDTTRMAELEYVRLRYKQMSRAIRENIGDITSENDLRRLLIQVQEITTYPEQLVSLSRQAEQNRSMDILDVGERSALHDANREYIRHFLLDADESIQEILDVLREVTGKIRPEHMDDFITLGEKFRLKSRMYRTFRLNEERIFQDRMPSKPARGPKNENWWRETNRQRAEEWNKLSQAMPAIEDDIEGLSEAISATHLPKPKKLTDKATIADVSYLFGVTGDDIARGLFRPDIQALIGKDQFKRWVRTKANVVGRQAGSNAETLGFTSEALDRVWDTLMRSINLDPREVKMLTPQYEALEGLRQEIHTIYQGRHVPESDIAKLRELTEEAADNLSRLEMFREPPPTAPPPAVPGVKQPWEMTREEFAQAFWLHGRGYSQPRFGEETAIGGITKSADEARAFTRVRTDLPGGPPSEGEIALIREADMPAFVLENIKGKRSYAPVRSVDWKVEGTVPGDVADPHQYLVQQAIKEGKPVPPEVLRDYPDLAGEAPPTAERPPVPSPARQDWFNKQESVMEKVRTEYSMTFTDYSPGNMVDAVMHGIFPFWNYESSRYPWLWRTFMRHPGMLTGLGRYMDATNGGYIPVPGTSLQLNPFRGTIFMGSFRSLFIRDYPEYLDAFPGFSNAIDYMSRAGFYPGVHILGLLVLFGTADADRRPEISQILPSWVKTPIDALIWQFPDSPVIQKLRDLILPNRMREIIALRYLGTIGIEGIELYDKVHNNISLTEDEQALWDMALSVASGYNMMFEQGLPFRMNPPERVEVYRLLSELYEDITGVPVEMQENINRRIGATGQRFVDIFPIDILSQVQIQEIEGLKQFAGSTAPFMPSGIQGKMSNIREYYREIESIHDQSVEGFYDKEGELERIGQTELDDRLMKWGRGEAGGIDPTQWKREMGELKAEVANRIKGLQGQGRFKDVPLTLEDRLQWMKDSRGIQATFHPSQEMLYLYYEQAPEFKYDFESGTMEWDFSEYFAIIDWMIEAIPEQQRDDFVKVIQKNMSPMQLLYWETNRNFIRPYRTTRDVELSMYTPYEREVIRKYTRAGPLQAGEYRAVVHEEPGKEPVKLISHYEKNLRQVRENIRLQWPEWNAWITFWSPGTKLLTDESKRVYAGLLERYLR